MNCPTDGTTLLMSERQGIEIDYCPECRGIWLDRGELDKILDRAQAEAAAFTAPGGAPATPGVAPAAQAPAPQAPAAPPAPTSGANERRYDEQRYDEQRYDERRSGDHRGYDDRRSDERGYGERGYGDRGYGDRRGYGDPRSRKKKSPFDFLGDIFE
ncbi:zf-TFIIB domain-containing protein [Leucobacter sp. PH1c]|uniref:TFIIB-type zinc ribbon-containing protein n=1 Tax=Leucobacter sp. PH1c TaxID=1397278 RepID=UPI000469D069|nr:zf-TFIIB domain-containing protein [Leucobacter sp. PH1c]